MKPMQILYHIEISQNLYYIGIMFHGPDGIVFAEIHPL